MEDDGIEVTSEMFITRNWLTGPGLYLSSGNKDSHDPFLHKIPSDGSFIMVTLLEAIIYNIYEEVGCIISEGFYNPIKNLDEVHIPTLKTIIRKSIQRSKKMT